MSPSVRARKGFPREAAGPGEDSLLWARRWVAIIAVVNVLCAVAVFFFYSAPDYFAERDYANTIDWGAFGRGTAFLAVVLGSLVIYFGLLGYRPWSRWAYLITNAIYLSVLIGGHALVGAGALSLFFTYFAILLVPGIFYLFFNRKARMLFRGETS